MNQKMNSEEVRDIVDKKLVILNHYRKETESISQKYNEITNQIRSNLMSNPTPNLLPLGKGDMQNMSCLQSELNPIDAHSQSSFFDKSSEFNQQVSTNEHVDTKRIQWKAIMENVGK